MLVSFAKLRLRPTRIFFNYRDLITPAPIRLNLILRPIVLRYANAPESRYMSTSSSSDSPQKLQDLVAAADSLMRQMSELQALRKEVAKSERALQMAKQPTAAHDAILKSSTFLPFRR